MAKRGVASGVNRLGSKLNAEALCRGSWRINGGENQKQNFIGVMAALACR